ncbi:C-3 sterol dehydrogenase/C-4 decarboxylase [Talaromyces proteolyticus]|uniref:Sterol-4-alpha-carboxylate 3-dehydrogenase ERG26, decarboxylating n=1 Tax=Talaromyces proteolyticus TaxID=1131652 RepID=A0AAD4KGR3_9EURO|nr:C-3 sterol dehydrogenase/C-4 decarboxylase [Talaromyces proteolyticus]KAH8691998.1 C-3 sterol dehydrogenase/C-4 decarboxylase [Talaromyces proteolyticus]
MAAQNSPTLELGTVLVVGGCGFLGWNIVNQLLNFPSETDPAAALPKVTNDPRFEYPDLKGRYPSYNAKVHIVDLRTTNNRLPGAQYHEGDLTSVPSMLEVFKKVQPDVVIHTASPAPLGSTDELLRKVNVDGTRTLVEVAGGVHGDWGRKCKAFVYTSSSSVVHDTRSDLINVNEQWPYVRGPAQGEYYSETKGLAEEIVLKANNNNPSGMLTCAIRPAGIVGEKDTTVSYKILEHGRDASNLSLRFQLGDNNNLFDFTYVGNIAFGHTLGAFHLLATAARLEAGKGAPLDYERVDGEAFNITNDQPMYFWDFAHALWALMDRVVEPTDVYALPEGLLQVIGSVAETIFSLLGKTPRLTRRAVRYSCMTRYYSCQKAKDRLGYSPVVDMQETAARTVSFWNATAAEAKSKKAQ